MELSSLIGISAALFLLIGMLSQIIKSYKMKKMDEMSYFLMICPGVASFLWLAYGLTRDDLIITFSSAISFFLGILLILMKWGYDKR